MNTTSQQEIMDCAYNWIIESFSTSNYKILQLSIYNLNLNNL